jgi:hypothetical protein
MIVIFARNTLAVFNKPNSMPFRKQQDFIKPNIQNFSFAEKLTKSTEVEKNKHRKEKNGLILAGKSKNFQLKESDKMKGYTEGIEVIKEDLEEDDDKYCQKHYRMPEEKKNDVGIIRTIPETKSNSFKIMIEIPDDYKGACWGQKEPEIQISNLDDKEMKEPESVKKESEEKRIERSVSEKPKVEQKSEEEEKSTESINCKYYLIKFSVDCRS